MPLQRILNRPSKQTFCIFPLIPKNLCYSCVNIDYVSKSDLILAVKNVKSRSSSGPDGIPAYIIKDTLLYKNLFSHFKRSD